MKHLYNKNGLVFFSQKEIEYRENCEREISREIFECMKSQNLSFQMIKIEAPLLTPTDLINPNYSKEDYYNIGDVSLRPETTMGSFEYAKSILSGGYEDIKYRAPIIIYQHGKSFRKEQDQPTKFMRLKEFYQLEFQIIYSPTTACDYSEKLFNCVLETLQKVVSKLCRIEPSDRLPSYSTKTMDIVVDDNNMEICSMSQRNDLIGFNVLEVAIGTDRLIYNYYRQMVDTEEAN